MTDPTSLEGRRVLVTGGAQGLGEIIAARVIDLGGTVVIADVQDDVGELTAERLGAAASFEHLDVSSADDWAGVMDRVTDRLGGGEAAAAAAAEAASKAASLWRYSMAAMRRSTARTLSRYSSSFRRSVVLIRLRRSPASSITASSTLSSPFSVPSLKSRSKASAG
jgi:NAD(P)-dependent dehydrogenase (short-subunit alcohol dehydrogenase family)